MLPRPLSRSRLALFGTLVAIGVGQALAAITIGLLVQRGFDTLVTGTAPITAAAALPIGGGLAVAVLLAATLRGVERFAAERLGQHYVLEVRETLFKHLTRVRHRVVGPEHAGLLLWTLSYRNSWSMIFHSDNNLVLHTAVLGLSPSADSLSVDAVLAHCRLDPQLRDWRYGLPSRLINAVTTATYFVAGVAKLMGPLGWSWATGESLRSQIAAVAAQGAAWFLRGTAGPAALRSDRTLPAAGRRVTGHRAGRSARPAGPTARPGLGGRCVRAALGHPRADGDQVPAPVIGGDLRIILPGRPAAGARLERLSGHGRLQPSPRAGLRTPAGSPRRHRRGTR